MWPKHFFLLCQSRCFSLVWVQHCLLACSKEIRGSNIQVPQNSSQGPESVLLNTALWCFFGHSSALRECKICKENIFSNKEWLGSTVKKESIYLFSVKWGAPLQSDFTETSKPWQWSLCFPDSCCCLLTPLPSFLLRMSITGALAPGRLDAGGQAAGWDQSPGFSFDYSKQWDPNTHQLAWSPEYSFLKWSVGLNPCSLAWHILCFFPGALASFPFLSVL